MRSLASRDCRVTIAVEGTDPGGGWEKATKRYVSAGVYQRSAEIVAPASSSIFGDLKSFRLQAIASMHFLL
jgi:hypothetical protein